MNLDNPIFHDDNAARAYMEAQRWAQGVVCPHCGGTEKCKRLEGAKHRPGLFQCGDCRQQFTVTVGTFLNVPRWRCTNGCWQLI